jgi:hypothetical protein
MAAAVVTPYFQSEYGNFLHAMAYKAMDFLRSYPAETINGRGECL